MTLSSSDASKGLYKPLTFASIDKTMQFCGLRMPLKDNLYLRNIIPGYVVYDLGRAIIALGGKCIKKPICSLKDRAIRKMVFVNILGKIITSATGTALWTVLTAFLIKLSVSQTAALAWTATMHFFHLSSMVALGSLGTTPVGVVVIAAIALVGLATAVGVGGYSKKLFQSIKQVLLAEDQRISDVKAQERRESGRTNPEGYWTQMGDDLKALAAGVQPPRHEREFRVITDPAVVAEKLLKPIPQEKDTPRLDQNFEEALQQVKASGFRGSWEMRPFSCSLTHDGQVIKIDIATSQGIKQIPNEDCHCVGQFKISHEGKESDVIMMGVFDGHGGQEAAVYMRNNLVATVKKYLQDAGLSEVAIFNALKLAFVELDLKFTELSGTTAVVGLWINGSLYTANSGDSRAVLNHQGKIKPLTKDATADPSDEEVVKRVAKRGGRIRPDRKREQRLEGVLTPAGTIGDHQVVGRTGLRCVLTRPAIRKVDLQTLEPGDAISFATDGLWDVVSSKKVAEKTGEGVEPRKLLNAAIQAGADDHVTLLTMRRKS